MKKLFGALMAVALVCAHTHPAAAGGYSHDPGCGLGSEIFKSGSTSIASQTLASTTNQVIFSNQMFGISTGSLGCTNSGHFAQNEQATLLSVPAEQQPAFFALTQEKYTTLIQSGEATPRAMLTALQEAMAAHPVLAQVR